jgi:hypothetical protein
MLPIEFQTGSLPKIVESVLDTPAYALARCPDVLQPIEKGITPRLGERHYSLQRLCKHPDQGVAEHKSDDLITADGRYDKAAILRDAHPHQYGVVRRHGWSWSRCLSFS